MNDNTADLLREQNALIFKPYIISDLKIPLLSKQFFQPYPFLANIEGFSFFYIRERAVHALYKVKLHRRFFSVPYFGFALQHQLTVNRSNLWQCFQPFHLFRTEWSTHDPVISQIGLFIILCCRYPDSCTLRIYSCKNEQTKKSHQKNGNELCTILPQIS